MEVLAHGCSTKVEPVHLRGEDGLLIVADTYGRKIKYLAAVSGKAVTERLNGQSLATHCDHQALVHHCMRTLLALYHNGSKHLQLGWTWPINL